MSDAPARQLDARYFEPPEPFVQTLAMLDEMAAGEQMTLLLFREPHPLYRVLGEQGHAWQSALLADGTFEIRITKAAG